MAASVVAFDPARDAAVLAVPGLTLPALGTAIRAVGPRRPSRPSCRARSAARAATSTTGRQ
jgi:hypothetical protein